MKVKVNVNVVPFGHYRTEEAQSESTVVMAPTPIIKDYTSISEYALSSPHESRFTRHGLTHEI